MAASLGIETIPVTLFAQNARIIWDTSTKDAVIIDPGGDSERLVQTLEKRGLTLRQIWLTHSHVDHVGGVAALMSQYSVDLLGHPNERQMRERVIEICRMYGMPSVGLADCPEPTQYLVGGETLTALGQQFEVIFTPGHSPGHLAFYCADAKVLLSGDVLFNGSIGRTDLPGGDFDTLIGSIRGLMEKLPGETRVLSGHGPDTTLARELATNPFLEELRS